MEAVDFNEEEATNKGGHELEEFEAEKKESGEEQKAKDPSTHATPTELESGGSTSGSSHDGESNNQ